MRSFSTLLVHILASSPELVGNREMHRSYASMIDVQTVADELIDSTPDVTAMDNILHNHHTLSGDVRSSHDCSWIVSVRQPLPTLKSLWRWGGGKTMPFREPGQALAYYEQRLTHLAELAPSLATGFVLLRADRIINHTEASLDLLGSALTLKAPLNQNYQIDTSTGDPANGDFSRFIRSGRIIKNRKHIIKPDLPEEEIEQARAIHSRSMELLSARASSVI